MSENKQPATSRKNIPERIMNKLARKIVSLAAASAADCTAVNGIDTLQLIHITDYEERRFSVIEPSVCLTVIGKKLVTLGNEQYVYDNSNYLISSLDLPIITQVLEAPYIGLLFKINLQLTSELLTEIDFTHFASKPAGRGMGVSKMTPELIEAFSRLLSLADNPHDIPILSPLIQKEILYRLLTGERGYQLWQITGKQSRQITHAIDWIKENYITPLPIKDLAARSSMSVSNFYKHFRNFTAMSPLQFQKKLRLLEARRLLLAENFDVATSAYRVGYESPSQFSREYKKFFGTAPSNDLRQISTP